MVFGRVFSVLGRVAVMPVGQMGVVCSGFVVLCHMLLGGFVVVARSVLMVFRCLGVVMGCFLGHGEFLSLYLVCSLAPDDYWRVRTR